MEKNKEHKPEEHKPDKKRYYTVEVEALIPSTVKYRVFAKDPEEAISLISKTNPIERPIQQMNRMRKITAKVYFWRTNMLQLLKRF